MSNLHCGQFSQVLALQIKQSVSEETETKQHVGGVNYYRTCSDKLRSVVPVSDCMTGSGLFSGRLLYLVLFVCLFC